MLSITRTRAAVLVALAVCSLAATAADWSDTSISWHYGTKFAEPFEGNDITKNIYSLTHVSGYKYGTNFFDADLLQSNGKDPGNGTTGGAQEVYVLYRNTVDLGKATGTEIKFTGVRGVGITFGFDWNTKNDAGYQSKKRMLVLGPTLNFDVPGHAEASIVLLKESNDPTGIPSRYTYKTHPALMADWGIPLGGPVAYEGYLDYIASKGKDEFGGDTKPETNFDSEIMVDIGDVMGGAKHTFRLGFEYQYWKNKFGNNAAGPAGSGAFAKTPSIRAEYHF